jgi:hypothetical protein
MQRQFSHMLGGLREQLPDLILRNIFLHGLL